MATLRDEITEKQTLIEDLRDSKRELSLVHEQLVRDYDKLKQEESDKSLRLHELLSANERREQARQDLKVLISFLFNINSNQRIFFLFLLFFFINLYSLVMLQWIIFLWLNSGIGRNGGQRVADAT